MENIKMEPVDLNFEDDNGVETKDLYSSHSDLRYFSDMILNTGYSVYALTGTWGSGKSSFIKMFKNIAERNNKNCIYINAFENDYQTEPFNIIIKSMAQYLGKEDFDGKKDFFDKAKQIAFRTGKAGVKIGLSLLLKKILGSNLAELGDLLTSVSNDFVDEFDYEKSEEEDIYSKFKTATKKLLEKKGNVIIIIDELDRCRPDFALETIEKVKHIFNVEGLKFILVYNEEIMNSIVTKTYGIENNVDRYMNKFIDKKYSLPAKLSNIFWLQKCIENLKGKGLDDKLHTIFMSKLNEFDKIMREKDISIRDMEKIFCNTPYINYTNAKSAPVGRDGRNSFILMCVVFELYKHLDKENAQALFEAMKSKIDNLEVYSSRNNMSLFYYLVEKMLNFTDKAEIEHILRNYVNWKSVH